jgi:hypothetical protein
VQCVLKREVFHKKKNCEASLTKSDALKNFISPSDNNETLTFGGSSSGITAAYPLKSCATERSERKVRDEKEVNRTNLIKTNYDLKINKGK